MLRCSFQKRTSIYTTDLLFGRKLPAVLRLISLTCLSANPLDPVLDLISYPFEDYDELKTLPKQNSYVCLIGRDGLQFGKFLSNPGPPSVSFARAPHHKELLDLSRSGRSVSFGQAKDLAALRDLPLITLSGVPVMWLNAFSRAGTQYISAQTTKTHIGFPLRSQWPEERVESLVFSTSRW